MVASILILAVGQLMLMSRRIPTTFSCLLILFLVSFFVLPFGRVVSHFGSEVVWLIFSTFILTGAIFESGLARRFSLLLLKQSQGNLRFLVFAFFLVMFSLTFIIPTIIGRAAILIPVVIGLIKTCETVIHNPNLAKSLFIGMNQMVTLTGSMLITGSNSSIYALSLFREYSNLNWDFVFWMAVFLPSAIVYMIGLWLIMLAVFPMANRKYEELLEYITGEIRAMGPLNRREKRILAILVFVISLWITEPWHSLSIAFIGFIGALLTLVPGFGIWDWKKAKNSMDWDMFILFGTSLVMADMLIQTKAFDPIVQFAGKFLSEGSVFGIAAAITLATFLFRVIFVNSMGFMSVALPLAFALAEAMQVNPIWMGALVFVAGHNDFYLVSQSPTNMMTYSYGYYSGKDHYKVGIWASLLWMAITVCVSCLYWPMLGISV